ALGGQMGTALTAAFAVNKISDFTHAIIDAQTNLDKLQNTLSFSLGAGQVTGQMDYLRKTTNVLGLEFGSTAVMYAKFAAAARGTSMEGRNTQKVFESIGKASTVMGLSAADTQGVMLALTQILSKGSVQAEEIRGQLGERLPGAFAIAARAMGVTTAEFSKMLELGQVVSADFLPKFAAQMEKEVAGSFDKASQSMQASLNRMSNAWLEFKQTVASSGAATAIAGEINGISNYMAVLTEAMQNARASGSGAIGELSSALGTMIARAPFDVLAFSANTLNGTLNMLSLGALKLNTNVDTLPGVFDTAAQRAAALDTNLLAAEKDLAQLRAKLDQVPDNIYLKSETHQAWLLVQELRAAKAAKDGLSGNTGPGNVSGIAGQYPTRSQSYAADAERVNKIRVGYEAVQQSLSGVSASYLKNLTALKAGFDEGMTTQEQYTKDVIALIDKETGFKKTAAKAQSEAAKAQEEARKAAAKGVALYNDLVSSSNGFTAQYAEQMHSLALAASAGALSIAEVGQAVALINSQQPGALADLKDKQAGLDMMVETITTNEKVRQSYLDAKDAAQEYLDTLRDRSNRAAGGVGKGDRYRSDQAGANSIEDKLLGKQSGLLRDKINGKLGEAEYREHLALAQSTYDQELDIYQQSLRDKATALADWTTGANDALANYLDSTANVAKSTQDMFAKAFQGMEDALLDFVKTGKLDFSSLADSIISDLMRIAIQQSITKPLAAAFSGMFADGGSFEQGGVQAFANGGTFTNSIVSEPTLFKFASGTGMMGEAGPEAIMPLARAPNGKLGVQATTAGGGNRMVVNIIESPGNGGQQSRRTENGVDILDVFVEKVKSAIAGDISQGSGAVPNAMSRTYGLNRVAGAY
ncbi:MAG: phage tail tape measure protein, partial [Ignavibacteriaceae bacterium]|nr:phage tail tape measure protein [Ignavibacteriaceae bacterium]